MRLIDADTLIEKCGEWYTEEGSEEGYIGTLKQLLDKQPTIEPKQDKAISIIDDMQREGIIDYEQAWEFRMRARMKGADNE